MAQPKLSEDEVADLREAFRMFDIDDNGTITLAELKEVLKSLGKNLSDDEFNQMINSIDDNGDNEIDFQEFLKFMGTKQNGSNEDDPDKELREAFKVFDANGDGTICRIEIQNIMKQLGQTLTDGELDLIMSAVDLDGSGEIDFQEFKQIMTGGTNNSKSK